MRNLFYLFISILLFLNCDLYSQSKKSKPVKISTQTATTKDGKTVILKNDGTWEYVKKALNQLCTVSLETGIVFTSGDFKPIVRTTFYIIDASLIEIIKNVKYTGSPYEELDVDSG